MREPGKLDTQKRLCHTRALWMPLSLCAVLLLQSPCSQAQQLPPAPTPATMLVANAAQSAGAATQSGSPIAISLTEAVRRAQQNEPTFAAARAAARSAALQPSIARAALLPGLIDHNQVLYTQPNGSQNLAGQTGTGQPSPIFIANNAVHEYASQALVTETLSVAQAAQVRAASAASAVAQAQLEIARRGLVAAVASLFYSVLATERKLTVLAQAKDAAGAFVLLTQQREAARESAHADVVKAQLTLDQRTRDVADATLARDRARLELAVLLFADPLTPYKLETASQPPTLPALDVIQVQARNHNPSLAAALATLQQSDAEVLAARAAYLPDASLAVAYGIDAPEFALNGPAPTHNLGYSLGATVDIPVWDWFATPHRVKQAEYRRDAEKVALTAAQKRLIIDLQDDYAEATTAFNALNSLATSAQLAQQSLTLTRLRYSNGEATVLEVVDAENTLAATQLAHQDGEVRYEQALSTLQALTGTL